MTTEVTSDKLQKMIKFFVQKGKLWKIPKKKTCKYIRDSDWFVPWFGENNRNALTSGTTDKCNAVTKKVIKVIQNK